MVVQFNRPDLRGGFVLAFRRSKSPYEKARFKLQGLDPTAQYVVTDLDTGKKARLSASELIEKGLPIAMPDRPSSAVLVYECLGK